MLPRVNLEGTLVADPELRFTASGIAVATCRVVCNDRKYNKDSGQYEDRDPTFINVTVWKQQGENIVEGARKGDSVVISGRLVQRDWTTQDGQKRSALEVTAEDIGVSCRFGVPGRQKTQRGQQGQDPWATPPQSQGQAQPQGQQQQPQYDQPPPF